MFEDDGFGIPNATSAYVQRSISAPPVSEHLSAAQLPLGYSSFLGDDVDIDGRYFGAGNEPSRLNPRMPKPKRTNDLSIGFGDGQFFEGDVAIHALGGVLDDVGNSRLTALLVDAKPHTPVDRIQADFPLTPSSVYSNRNLNAKQQETSRFVNTQDESDLAPLSPMSSSVSHHRMQSPLALKSSSSSLNINADHISNDSRDEGASRSSPVKSRDFASMNLAHGTQSMLDQTAAGLSQMNISQYGPGSNHHSGSHPIPQQHMMQPRGPISGYMHTDAIAAPGQMNSFGYRGQNPSMHPQYAHHMGGGYMPQQEPVLGSSLPTQQYYMQPQGMNNGASGPGYGGHAYYGSSGASGMNPAGGQMAYQQQVRHNGVYGSVDHGTNYSMYSVEQQQMPSGGGGYWDGSGALMNMGDRGMPMRVGPGMMYPQQQQQQMMAPPQASQQMYSGSRPQMSPVIPSAPGGQPAMWSNGVTNVQTMPAHIQQSQSQPQVQSSNGSSAGPMLYSQILNSAGDSSNSTNGSNSPTQRLVVGSAPGRGDLAKDTRRPGGTNSSMGGRANAPVRGAGPRSTNGQSGTVNSSSGGSPSAGTRDSLVEEFRNTFGKSKQWEIKDLVGHIVAFCQDQHGSRFIQQRLEVAPDSEKQLVFDELVPSAQSLMTDVFGNYVIQKLFEFGTPSQCEMLASMLMGQAVALALQMYGCRVIQKALEYVKRDRLVALVGEFEGQQVLRCVHDQNGNHVIQKCIEVVSRNARESDAATSEFLSSKIQFIINAFHGRVRELSMHPYGCRVVQRILEHCNNAQKAPILEELRKCCNELVQDQYGNYVIQHVMQHGWDTDKALLIREVQSRLLEYSQHKFASNVVEKCLQYANRKDRDEMIWTIIHVTFDLNNPVDVNTGQCVLESMVRDPYANYVVQKVIDVSDERQRGAIVRYVKENIVQLRRYTYGKHIIVRLEKACNEKF